MVIDEVDTCFFYDDGPGLREEFKYWRKDLGVTLAGIPLDNPVIPASGTFGYGAEFAELYDINCLGTFSFKGTTLEPRFGNPTPRIAEAPQGMLNAVGLQNPGVEKVISEELPRMKEFFHKPVMANVSGFSIDEYAQTCALLDREEQVGWLEVNISCPNVHGGGMAFGSSPEAAAEVTRAVKAVTKKPVFMKLSPNVTGEPHQHPAGHADRPENKKARAGQRHGGALRTGGVPGSGADGVSGLRGGGHPHHRHGGRILGGGRD